MTSPAPRHGLSIFARTFLLLAVALLVAQGIGIALLILRTPVYSPPVQLPEVVALLSSQMPSDNKRLRVYVAAVAPKAPAGEEYGEDARMRATLARWLGREPAQVRFYRRWDADAPPFDGQRPTDGLPPPGSNDLPGRAGLPGNGEPGFQDRGPPPGDMPPPPDGQPPFGDVPPPPHDRKPPDGVPPPPAEGGSFPPHFDLREDFIAAARQADGRWRVVEHTGWKLSGQFKRQVALLFVLGLLAMLPMAWWFARALSSPIRRFADAADQLGRNPDAPPLARSGPSEIVQAADSFNIMQARLNRLISERTHMVGAIAHDLRTPLARLAFRLDSAPASLREKAIADIEEMKAMISAALDFIRDHSRPGAREMLDFRLLVESVADDLSDTGHEVSFEPGNSVPLSGDPLALRRMVTNLIENALKYGTRARLSLQRTGSDTCRLWIDDDGPGIDPAQREQLFMPFFRGEASRNRETGGIGLGLSAAHNIVLAHGGEIALDNRPEGGLRVTVLLPCAPEAEGAKH